MQLGFKPHPLVFYLHLNTDTDVKMPLHAINTPTGRLWLHPHWGFMFLPADFLLLWITHPTHLYSLWTWMYSGSHHSCTGTNDTAASQYKSPRASATPAFSYGTGIIQSPSLGLDTSEAGAVGPWRGGGEGWCSGGLLEIPNKGFCRLN